MKRLFIAFLMLITLPLYSVVEIDGLTIDGAIVLNFKIEDGADPTKILDFDVSAITTGTTRTVTAPDAEITLTKTTEVTIINDVTKHRIINDAGATTTDLLSASKIIALILAVTDVVSDTTPELGGELDAGAHSIGFSMQTALGDGTTTIDWRLGNHIDFTFGAFNETFTFTDPSNPGIYSISLLQDSVGTRLATWPATGKWPGGTAPVLTTTATTGYDIVYFRFDGTNYYGYSQADYQ